jgi:hypothetical protein
MGTILSFLFFAAVGYTVGLNTVDTFPSWFPTWLKFKNWM